MKLKALHDQVVVIIGASSGIGRATALQLAEKNAKLVVAARSREGIISLVEEIQALRTQSKNTGSEEAHKGHGNPIYVPIVDNEESNDILREYDSIVGIHCDVTVPSSVEMVARTCISKFGRIDTWIHTAGVMQFSYFQDTTEEEMKRIMDVNFMGACRSAWTAVPILRKQGFPTSLIFLTSVEARRAINYQSAYSASKHAMEGFIEALRVELMEQNAQINLVNILPSHVNSSICDKARQKMPGSFKYAGPPPTYSPELVANSILFAAQNPKRDIIVGDAGYIATWLQFLMPGVLDTLMSKTGHLLEKTGAHKNEATDDNLFLPADTRLYTIHGQWHAKEVSFSLYNWITENSFIRTAPKVLFYLYFWWLMLLIALVRFVVSTHFKPTKHKQMMPAKVEQPSNAKKQHHERTSSEIVRSIIDSTL